MSDSETTSPQSANRAIMTAVRQDIRKNLPAVAAQLLAWHKTGLLPDGVVQELAQRLTPVVPNDAIGTVEKLARDTALEVCAGLATPTLIAEITALQQDYAERAKPGYSGFIDPSPEDLAKEDGERNAYGNVADDLASLIETAKQAQ